ncbi:aquaporin-8 [Haloactinopolyspora alba]|uniref:Aquaporin-8 n=1 Tax=Haloactinopolyspora alba TaxID=648780 RepID=A0A2P8DRG0_9ACTN|nr:aquaporin [Haloactinopolyspora alba]PSK99806.1 aquaporin-8 [Haloactinopolyspora alba]
MADGWLRNAVVEAIGTMALVFVTVMVLGVSGLATPAALAYGFIVAALVASLGHISGGHFNPAITLAMLLARKIDVLGAAAYWVAQFAGGAVGALVVMLSTSEESVAAGTTRVNEEVVSIGGAIALEALATFILVLVVFGTVLDERSPVSVYPFAIGGAIIAGNAGLLQVTGGALNPARGFGPAVVSGEWDGLAAWLAGPLIGAALAWVLYQFVISDRQPSKPDFPEPVPPPPGPSLLP